jgi:hypothetical protein
MAGSTGLFKEQVLAPLVLLNRYRVNPTCTIREIYDWRSGATGYSQVLIDKGDLLKYLLRPDTRFGGHFRKRESSSLANDGFCGVPKPRRGGKDGDAGGWWNMLSERLLRFAATCCCPSPALSLDSWNDMEPETRDKELTLLMWTYPKEVYTLLRSMRSAQKAQTSPRMR